MSSDIARSRVVPDCRSAIASVCSATAAAAGSPPSWSRSLILPAFSNPALDALDDQAILARRRRAGIAFTTDSFVVTPIFFPGRRHRRARGERHGQRPRGRRRAAARAVAAFILEEGLPLADLGASSRRCGARAERAGVPLVTGDTKVVERGKGDRSSSPPPASASCPAGVRCSSRARAARRRDPRLGHDRRSRRRDPGAARGPRVRGDARERHRAARTSSSRRVLDACPRRPRDARSDARRRRGDAQRDRDAPRARHRGRRGRAPDPRAVRGACELLGLDPLLVANEGKLVAFVPEATPPTRARRDARASARPGRGSHRHGHRRHPGSVVELAHAGRRHAHRSTAVRRAAAADLLIKEALR